MHTLVNARPGGVGGHSSSTIGGGVVIQSSPQSGMPQSGRPMFSPINAPLVWSQDHSGLTITAPSEPPCQHAYSLKITFGS